jgi:hypothetical protein
MEKKAMLFNRIRIALLVCNFVAIAALSVQADDKAPDKKPEPIPAPAAAPVPAPAPAPCAPAMKTICVTEWVPESYTATRTVYKKECVAEKFTAYKTECVPETKTRTFTVLHKETYEVEELRTVCVSECVQEERLVTKRVVTCVPVTTTVCKTVDNGHWECKEVECGPTFKERLAKLTSKLHRHDECGCDPCATCNTCEAACPRTKTVRVWVSCKTTVQVPCTKMERKVECVQEKCLVSVKKLVPHQEKVKVCKTRCVPEVKTETYTCLVKKCVAVEETRNVIKCVPVCETYTACRMVKHTVEKQVPCAPCACECACECKPEFGARLKELLHKLHGHHCDSCDTCSSCATCGH